MWFWIFFLCDFVLDKRRISREISARRFVRFVLNLVWFCLCDFLFCVIFVWIMVVLCMCDLMFFFNLCLIIVVVFCDCFNFFVRSLIFEVSFFEVVWSFFVVLLCLFVIVLICIFKVLSLFFRWLIFLDLLLRFFLRVAFLILSLCLLFFNFVKVLLVDIEMLIDDLMLYEFFNLILSFEMCFCVFVLIFLSLMMFFFNLAFKSSSWSRLRCSLSVFCLVIWFVVLIVVLRECFVFIWFFFVFVVSFWIFFFICVLRLFNFCSSAVFVERFSSS